MVGTGVRRQALWMRRDLWLHVDAAETAVKAARATDTPVGELPALVGHLRDQARRHDHALVLVAHGVRAIDLVSARDETDRIVSQADMVSTAAVEAIRADTQLGSDQLAVALDRETRAVADGSARLRSLTAR
jgi:DNA-binding transcriptional regulator YiaG